VGAQWCESFQVYPSTANMLQGVWAQLDAGIALSTANPSSGTQGLRFTPGSVPYPAARRVFNQAVSTAGCAFRFYVPSLPNTETVLATVLLSFLDVSGNPQVSLVLGSNGAIVALGGGLFQGGSSNVEGMTLLARSQPCVVPLAYNHIEALVTPGATGTVEVRVNGVTVVNFTGDTLGHNEVGQVAISCGDSGTGDMDIGDLHAYDSLGTPGPQTFVGNAIVLTRTLTADESGNEWTLSAGASAYPLLEDNEDTTYIEADTVGLTSSFAATALPGEVTGVVYQQVNFRGVKTNAGDCDVQAGIISGSSVGQAASASVMSTGESWFWGIVAEDPATSNAPFTPASASASQALLTRTV
jgi:hypothetical protein